MDSRKLGAYERSARQLARWIDQHLGLLRGLVELRDLGPDADDAVAAVGSVPEIVRIVAGWALWEAIAAGDGLDAEALLVQEIPYTRVALARRALWGFASPDGESRFDGDGRDL